MSHARFAPALTFVLVIAGCSQSSGSSSGATAGDGGAASGDAASTGPHACDPLNAPSTPLALANLLGAGRHADGTYYVVDDGGRDHQRAFVSSGTVLQRYIVAGSGEAGGALTLSLTDPEVTIRIDDPGPHPTRMAVFRGKLGDKTFDPSTQGDALELVGLDALSGMTPMNVPDNVTIEYNASLADGRRFFVTRPKVDWAYEDFHVFFGTPGDMRERPLVRASRGSTTYITFAVDGKNYDAVIPAPPPIGSANDHPTLTPAGGAALDLTLLGTDASARAGLSFVCL